MMGALAEVECTIQSLGPTYAQWEKRHPFTNQITVNKCFTKGMTDVEKEEFRTNLYLKRQEMPVGPAGSEHGKIVRQRSAPTLMIPGRETHMPGLPGRDRSQTFPRPNPFNRNSPSVTPVTRSRAGSSENRTRSRAGSTNSQGSGYSADPTPRLRSKSNGIKFCRPRRHVPVNETPGAFLAKDLNEFRRQTGDVPGNGDPSPRPFAPQFTAPQFSAPQFRQPPSVGKMKGGKPMNMEFGGQFQHNVGQFRKDGTKVPERFRNLNETRSSPRSRTRAPEPPAGISWRSQNYQPVLKPHGDSTGSSTSSVEQAGAKRPNSYDG